MYERRRREIENKMLTELSGTYLTERERLIVKMCSVVATREVLDELRKEREEISRDLENIVAQALR